VEKHTQKEAEAGSQKKEAENDALVNILASSRHGCHGCGCQHGTGGSCHDWQLWQRCNPIPSQCSSEISMWTEWERSAWAPQWNDASCMEYITL